MFLSKSLPTAIRRCHASSKTGGQSLSTMSSSGGEKQTFSTMDLVDVIAESHDLTKAESRRIIATTFDSIQEAVAKKKRVSIYGFGSFQSVHSKERWGRNPSSGERLLIPAKERVKFTPQKAFKESINK